MGIKGFDINKISKQVERYELQFESTKKGHSSYWMSKAWGASSTQDAVIIQNHKAISNFVNIVTGDPNIKARFANDNKDSNVITVPAVSDLKDFDFAVGETIHKAALYRYGDPRIVQAHGATVLDYVVENIYVDTKIHETSPGYVDYLSAKYLKSYLSPRIHEYVNNHTQDNIRNHSVDQHTYAVNINYKLFNPTAKSLLPGMDEIMAAMDVSNIRNMSADQRRHMVQQVRRLIDKYITEANQPEMQPPPQESQGEGEPQQNKQQNKSEQNTSNSKDNKKSDNNESSDKSNKSEDVDKSNSKDNNQSTVKGESEDSEQSDTGESEQSSGGGNAHDQLFDEQMFAALNKAAKDRMAKQDLDIDMVPTSTIQEEISKINKPIENGTTSNGMVGGTNLRKLDELLDMKAEVLVDPLYPSTKIFKYNVKNLVYKTSAPREYMTHAYVAGQRSAKKIITRNESRTTESLRQTRGKLHNGHIHMLGVDIYDVFKRVQQTTQVPVLFNIQIDGSGSMSGHRMKQSVEAVCYIAGICKNLTGVDLTVSVRTEEYRTFNSKYIIGAPALLELFDSRKMKWDEILKYIGEARSCNGGTPDSIHYYDFIKLTEEARKRNTNVEVYNINISDGAPDSNSHTVPKEFREMDPKVCAYGRDIIVSTSVLYINNVFKRIHKASNGCTTIYMANVPEPCLNCNSITEALNTVGGKIVTGDRQRLENIGAQFNDTVTFVTNDLSYIYKMVNRLLKPRM